MIFETSSAINLITSLAITFPHSSALACQRVFLNFKISNPEEGGASVTDQSTKN